MEQRRTRGEQVPEFFRPLLWSYCFEEIDPVRHQEILILQAINYGTLAHWRWVCRRYGKTGVRHVLQQVPVSMIRAHVRKLVSLLFGIAESQYNHAPRGTH